MDKSLTMDEIAKLLRFPFEDQKWKSKLAVASLLALVAFPLIIPGIFLSGYVHRIMRRIIREGGEPYLPEWDNWGDLLKDGFQLYAAQLIIALPFLLLFLVVGIGVFVPYTQMIAYPEQEITIVPMIGILISPFLMMCMGLPMFVVGIISQAAICHVIDKNSILAMFDIRDWWPIFRSNAFGFFLAYILVMGMMMIVNLAAQFLMLTIIFICLYPIVIMILSVYLSIIMQILFSRAYVTGKNRLNAQAKTIAS